MPQHAAVQPEPPLASLSCSLKPGQRTVLWSIGGLGVQLCHARSFAMRSSPSSPQCWGSSLGGPDVYKHRQTRRLFAITLAGPLCGRLK